MTTATQPAGRGHDWDWASVRALCLREARRVLGPATTADDAAQEAAIRAWRQRAHCRTPRRPNPWIAAIAVLGMLALLAIYERSRDWAQASEIARKLEASGQGNFSGRLAHYLCEQALAHAAHGDLPAADAQLREAIAAAPQAPRAYIELARLQQRMGRSSEALATLHTPERLVQAGRGIAQIVACQVAARLLHA